MDKEQIYDSEISALMDRIADICQKNNIAMLASFYIPTEENPTLSCTTALMRGQYGNNAALESAYRIITGGSEAPVMVSTRDNNGDVVAMTAII